MVEAQCVTEQQVMRLDTLYLLDLLLAYLYLDQSHLGKQGQHHTWCLRILFWDLSQAVCVV